MATSKIDNSKLEGKLALRRYFLERYHADSPIRVFDCCAGQGKIWTELRKDFKVESYLATDTKSSTGARLKMNSVRLLKAGQFSANVIDVDTYGSPWKHWLALLPQVHSPVTVFLTIGQPPLRSDSTIYSTMGLNFTRLKVPPTLATKVIRARSLGYMLSEASKHGLQLVEVMEAPQGGSRKGNVRYVGVHLRPTIL